MEGSSLVTDIRIVDEHTPLIFLTARTQNEDVIKGLKLCANDYLKKTFSMDELILRSKSLVCRRVALIKLWVENNVFNARSIDFYITRLRKFLKGNTSLEIVNSRRQGYILRQFYTNSST